MDAKQFIAEFGHIVDAPSGVDELRKLVLHLAVTGRLVSSTGEATAKSFLEEIEIVQQERIALKEIKQNKKIEPLPSKFPFEIPKSWQWVRFGNLCHFVAGRTPPRKESVYWNTGEYPWFSIADMSHQEVISVSSETVSQDAREKSFKCPPVKAGTLIMSFKLTIGRLSVLGVDAYHNEAIISIYPFASELNDYFLKCLNGFDLSSGNKAAIKGNTLNQDSISNLLVAVPPKGDIPALLAKVDELMSLCDKLEEQQKQKRQVQNQLRQTSLQSLAEASSPFELKQHWQRIYDHLGDLFSVSDDVQEFRNLVVDLAVSGKLTEKSSKADQLSVSGLLDSLEEMKTGKRFAKKSVPDEPFDVPLGWKWVLMEDLLKGSESGWSPKCHSEPRQNEQWGVLKVSAVTWGEFKPEENKCLPLSLDPRPEAETLPGDFLLSRANTAELVARSVIVPPNAPKNLMMSDKIVRLQFLDERLKEWVNLVNSSSYAREYYYQRATGTSDSMRNVSRQVMHELPVPILSIEQQGNTLRKMDSFLELCSLLEKKIQQKVLLAEKIAITTIAKLVGVDTTQEEERLKTPKTELIAPVNLGKIKPSSKDDAPLATLIARQSGQMNANDLWQRFGGEIDAFYAQLKVEVTHGWIAEPETANMLEKDEE
ncbi:restriction endonuclease subunit S [Vibrio splendidus]|uniref:restriction endonuclease subunit S n=1 Tax=Vibrio splendidus TaxID=29497 RepID=UPI000D37C077|nr:restriction endonuclease subunit S [Vibrio splendidus]PTP34942.1 type I restriction endonuclease subunit S [Vibrio splendidus]